MNKLSRGIPKYIVPRSGPLENPKRYAPFVIERDVTILRSAPPSRLFAGWHTPPSCCLLPCCEREIEMRLLGGLLGAAE